MGTDDNMSDAFNDWLGLLEVYEVIEYANEALAAQRLKYETKND